MNELNVFLNNNLLLLWIVLGWSLCLKGLALWTAAKKEQKAWFIALLVVNTLGVLEIFYLFIFSKYSKKFAAGGGPKEEAVPEIK